MGGILDILKTVGTKYITLSILDILIVSLLFYVVLRAIQNTRTLQLAEGIALYFISVFLVSYLSDKIGTKVLAALGTGIILLCFYPIFLWLFFNQNYGNGSQA